MGSVVSSFTFKKIFCTTGRAGSEGCSGGLHTSHVTGWQAAAHLHTSADQCG